MVKKLSSFYYEASYSFGLFHAKHRKTPGRRVLFHVSASLYDHHLFPHIFISLVLCGCLSLRVDAKMRITLLSLLSFIFYYFIYHSIHISFVSSKCLEDQQSLLLQLKNNLTLKHPESSSKLKLWNQSIACCNWRGVTCDNEGHVMGLDLSRESISDGFDDSSSLFGLQHLQKLNLAFNNFDSLIPSGFSKLEKLTYLNLSHACFEGQIPMEISQLTRLVTLDISNFVPITADRQMVLPMPWRKLENLGNGLKLKNPNLRKLVQNLTSIRQLYLDGASISDQGKGWCNALLPLRDLQELSMSGCELSGPLDSSLTRLENLSVIILDRNNFSSPVPETFANFKNLTSLILTESRLTGRFPQKIFQIGTLSVVDLSSNYNLHGSFPDFPLSGSLQSIIVGNTKFSGALPFSIGNLRHLSILDLSNCQFSGTLPNSLSSLSQLSHLVLSFNSFTGPMPSFGMAKNLTYLYLSHNGLSGTIPSSSHFQGLHNLVSVDLSYNSINGSIPSSLFTLPLLDTIYLSFNKFSKLDELTNVSSSILTWLDLSNNNLSGPFPTFIFQLSSLTGLRLSYNKFNGSLHLGKLLELRNLTAIDLSYNSLSVDVNMTNADQSSLPSIQELNMASCNLKTFPGFLINQSTLVSLDLSHNQIQGIVPNWIWKLQRVWNLDISHNLLTDLEGPLRDISSNLISLNLQNNQLQGPIPVFLKDVQHLDYSMNKFSSVIPDSLCSVLSLQLLDLSFNNISGIIPSCLLTMNVNLRVLNLRKNNLIGAIPDMFPASCALGTLNLHENLLHGPIPKSFANCTTLEVLDIGTNQMVDGFPCFLNKIPTLRVLVLRNNKFQGSIRCLDANKHWQMIQIVDIAVNNFSGKLAGKYFTTWDKMMHDEDHSVSDFIHTVAGQYYYQDSLTIFNKGQQMEIVKILTVLTAIDFSSNHFEGPIPDVLMDFKALHVLNFSNNDLSGEIPSSIGNLKQLESLDLSSNSLGGEIPVQIASLSFLSYLNLSFNHLVGKIPTGPQLQTFPASSFEGNDGLYGPPLTGKPDDKKEGLLPQPTCRRLACSIDWNFISVELGFVFGFGIVIGPLLFWKQWRVRYWKLVDKILCWIFPKLYLDYATHRGQTYTVLRWWWH